MSGMENLLDYYKSAGSLFDKIRMKWFRFNEILKGISIQNYLFFVEAIINRDYLTRLQYQGIY